jgi:hypothetical protein
MQIDVYQDSINKVFPEYLVNFKYLTQLMDQYGFALLSADEAHHRLGLPAGSGRFEELYRRMQHDLQSRRIVKEEYGAAADMSPEEQAVSFLNRYFVFKKTHTVNTENLYKIIRNRAPTRRADQPPTPPDQPPSPDQAPTQVPTQTTVTKAKKLSRKITIQCDNPLKAPSPSPPPAPPSGPAPVSPAPPSRSPV